MDILSKFICNMLGNKSLTDISIHEIKSKIGKTFEIFWAIMNNKDSKLRTNQKMKDNFKYEDYLEQF